LSCTANVQEATINQTQYGPTFWADIKSAQDAG
jgi:hypothetical protein